MLKGASAKDGEGAGRGPCGLRNSELGPLPHKFYNKESCLIPQKIPLPFKKSQILLYLPAPLGYRQVVRQRILIPLFVGSNPATPMNFFLNPNGDK